MFTETPTKLNLISALTDITMSALYLHNYKKKVILKLLPAHFVGFGGSNRRPRRVGQSVQYCAPFSVVLHLDSEHWSSMLQTIPTLKTAISRVYDKSFWNMRISAQSLNTGVVLFNRYYFSASCAFIVTDFVAFVKIVFSSLIWNIYH